ncbi:unnamed protein product [Somion occarium]|uniref:F-box domain-containing protein n=1 Tax=Somion occarium TaxID=3059160 RepID=A0ABP1E5Y4_9APHY
MEDSDLKGLLSLPNEILLSILGSLNLTDLLKCRLISSRFDSVIRSDASFQYAIELRGAGYEEIRASGRDLSERMATLRGKEDKWKNPNLHVAGHVDSPTAVTIPSNNIFHRVTIVNGAMVTLGYHTATDPQCGKALELLDFEILATTCTVVPKVLRFDFPFMTFHIDPIEDLLVLAAPDPSLNTGKPHPRTRQPEIEIPLLPFAVTFDDLLGGIKTFGDLLAIRVRTSTLGSQHGTYHLYHWPSGRLIRTWSESPLSDTFQAGIILVNDGYVLLLVSQFQPVALQMVEVYATRPSSNGGFFNIDLVAKFILPPLTHHGLYLLQGESVGFSGMSSTVKPIPHILVHLTIDFRLRMFTPLSTFLNSQVRSHPVGASPRIFLWSEWGPKNTRFVPYELRSPPPVVIGLRVILSGSSDWYTIWDFSPRRRQEHISGPGSKRLAFSVHMPSDVVEASETLAFAEDVEATLPCLVDAIKLPASRLSVNAGAYYIWVDTMDGPKVLKMEYEEGIRRFDVISF